MPSGLSNDFAAGQLLMDVPNLPAFNSTMERISGLKLLILKNTAPSVSR